MDTILPQRLLKTQKLSNFVKAFEQNTENTCAGVSSYFSPADISTLQVNSAGLFIRPSRPWRMAPELFGVPATLDQNSGLDLTVKENYYQAFCNRFRKIENCKNKRDENFTLKGALY